MNQGSVWYPKVKVRGVSKAVREPKASLLAPNCILDLRWADCTLVYLRVVSSYNLVVLQLVHIRCRLRSFRRRLHMDFFAYPHLHYSCNFFPLPFAAFFFSLPLASSVDSRGTCTSQKRSTSWCTRRKSRQGFHCNTVFEGLAHNLMLLPDFNGLNTYNPSFI